MFSPFSASFPPITNSDKLRVYRKQVEDQKPNVNLEWPHLYARCSSSLCIFLASSSSITAAREQGRAAVGGGPQGFLRLGTASEGGGTVWTPNSMTVSVCVCVCVCVCMCVCVRVCA